eukprot:2489847-Prymnesium_polylepis.1
MAQSIGMLVDPAVEPAHHLAVRAADASPPAGRGRAPARPARDSRWTSHKDHKGLFFSRGRRARPARERGRAAQHHRGAHARSERTTHGRAASAGPARPPRAVHAEAECGRRLSPRRRR